MGSRRFRTLVGVAMVLLGLLQAIVFGLKRAPLPVGLGLVYAGLGVAYLWAEVYAVDP